MPRLAAAGAVPDAGVTGKHLHVLWAELIFGQR